MVSFEYVDKTTTQSAGRDIPASKGSSSPRRSVLLSTFSSVASLLDDPRKRRLIVLSVPALSFTAFAIYRQVSLKVQHKKTQKALSNQQSDLQDDQQASAAEQRELQFKASIDELTQFFGLSLLSSLALEELSSLFRVRGLRPYPVLGAAHSLIPLSIAYYLSHHQPQLMTTNNGDDDDAATNVLQMDTLKSGLKTVFKSKKLWLQIFAVSALQVTRRVILPYLSSHEEQYRSNTVLYMAIKLHQWEQKLTAGHQQLETSIDNLTLRVIAQFIDQMAQESQFVLATYCEEHVWHQYVSQQLDRLGLAEKSIQRFLLSAFLRVSWHASIYLHGIRNFSLTGTSLDGSVVSPFSIAVDALVGVARSYLMARMLDWVELPLHFSSSRPTSK